MATLTIELPPATYQALRRRAEQVGKDPETVTLDILRRALSEEEAPPKSVREILAAAGHLRPLGPMLKSMIIPDVTLEEVQGSLARAGGRTLSEIVLEQRGRKA